MTTMSVYHRESQFGAPAAVDALVDYLDVWVGTLPDQTQVLARHVTDNGGFGPDDDCPLCLEPLAGARFVAQLAPCGHDLHLACCHQLREAAVAAAGGAEGRCPMCRGATSFDKDHLRLHAQVTGAVRVLWGQPRRADNGKPRRTWAPLPPGLTGKEASALLLWEEPEMVASAERPYLFGEHARQRW
jgi:hypothetical protein